MMYRTFLFRLSNTIKNFCFLNRVYGCLNNRTRQQNGGNGANSEFFAEQYSDNYHQNIKHHSYNFDFPTVFSASENVTASYEPLPKYCKRCAAEAGTYC